MNMDTRPPPPGGAPPPYSRAINRVYRGSLRFPFVFTSGFGILYGLILGVGSIQNAGNDNKSGTLRTFDVVMGAMFLALAGVEVALLTIGLMNKTKSARWISILAVIGGLLAIAICVLRLVLHFTLKSSLIAACVKSVVGTTITDGFGDSETINSSDAQSYCDSDWNRGTWRDIIWLIAILLVVGLWVAIALSYRRQLLDPASIRMTGAQQPDSYPLQNQPSYAYPAPSYDLPQYPGPPANFAPPAGKEEFSYAAQEEAWQQAQASSEARYQPPAGPPPGQSSSGGQGYEVPIHNEEEDAAWARAQREGPTAHFTGDRNPFADASRKDGGVV